MSINRKDFERLHEAKLLAIFVTVRDVNVSFVLPGTLRDPVTILVPEGTRFVEARHRSSSLEDVCPLVPADHKTLIGSKLVRPHARWCFLRYEDIRYLRHEVSYPYVDPLISLAVPVVVRQK